jgi:hypothetical protein
MGEEERSGKGETGVRLKKKPEHFFYILFYPFYLILISPRKVSSFGSRHHFKKESKPKEAGAATRCLDCSLQGILHSPYSPPAFHLLAPFLSSSSSNYFQSKRCVPKQFI